MQIFRAARARGAGAVVQTSVGLDGISRARYFLSRVEVVLGLCAATILDQLVQQHFCRRTSSFNRMTTNYDGVLGETFSTSRDTLIRALAGNDASNMQVQIFCRFSLFATWQARRAARGLPRDAAPRPTPSLLTLLPSPTSLLPYTPSLAPGVGVGGCGLGGREGGRRSPSSSSTSLPLRAHSTPSRRSLDARSTLARPRRVDIAGAAMMAERTGGGRPCLRSRLGSQWRPIQGTLGCGFGSIES